MSGHGSRQIIALMPRTDSRLNTADGLRKQWFKGHCKQSGLARFQDKKNPAKAGFFIRQKTALLDDAVRTLGEFVADNDRREVLERAAGRIDLQLDRLGIRVFDEGKFALANYQ